MNENAILVEEYRNTVGNHQHVLFASKELCEEKVVGWPKGKQMYNME